MELAAIFTTLAVTFTDEGLRFIAAGLVMGLGALATPIGIGRLVASAMEALGATPEALPAIQTNMILRRVLRGYRDSLADRRHHDRFRLLGDPTQGLTPPRLPSQLEKSWTNSDSTCRRW